MSTSAPRRLRALAALSQEDPSELMRRHLSDPEPRVAVAAATALAGSQPADAALAEATLKRLVADSRDAGVPGAEGGGGRARPHRRTAAFGRSWCRLLYDLTSRSCARRFEALARWGPRTGCSCPA